MKKNLIYLLLCCSLVANAQSGYRSIIPLLGGVPPAPSESIVYIDQFTSDAVPKDRMVYLPPGYEDNTDNYPVAIYYGGDGAKGVATYTTGVSLSGSGTGPYTGNFVNTTSVEVAAGSVEIFDGATLVARGKTDGTLLAIGGSGVTGTIAHTATNGAVSVSFTSTPAGAVTMDYAKSSMFVEAAPMYLNGGDEPPGLIIVSPQINVTDFSSTFDFQELKTSLITDFRIDTTRIYVCGVSRGGRGSRIIFQDKFAQIAALYTATQDYTGWSTDDWVNYKNKGVWVHAGTSDGTFATSGMLGMINNSTQSSSLAPPIGTPYFGIGHSSVIWNTETFNRKDRTDGVGTSDHDWVQWIKKFSTDSVKQATLFTENAEYTNDIIDYRYAYNHVYSLGAGSFKTALLARLDIVKPLADKGGVRYIIDPGAATTSVILPETSGTNVNSMTIFTATSSSTNIVAEDKSASTINFEVITQASTSPTNRVATMANRINKKYWGYSESSMASDGARLLNGVSGEWEFNTLPDATYDVRIYYSNAGTNISQNSNFTVSIGGDSKSVYAQINGYRYLEWTGLSRDGSNKIVMSTSNSGNTFSHAAVIELLKY